MSKESERTSRIAFGMKPSGIGQTIEVIFGHRALVNSGIKVKTHSIDIALSTDEMEEVKGKLNDIFTEKGGLSEEEMEHLREALVQKR